MAPPPRVKNLKIVSINLIIKKKFIGKKLGIKIITVNLISNKDLWQSG